MLILTQGRSTIVNLDRFDLITLHPAQAGDNENCRAIVAIQFTEGDKEEGFEPLGLYMKKETAEEILFEITDAARTGISGYIMPD